MTYEPKYSIPSGATPVKTSLTPVTINGKSIPGYQTTFSDGTSKWIRYEDAALSSNFDYSTFTGTKKSDGTWTWSGTTDKSISNLAGATGLTEQQINDGLYKTPTLQNSLNGTRVQQLGGTQAAQKIDPSIPQSSGTSVNPNAPVDQGSVPSGEGGTTATQEGINKAGGILTTLTVGDDKKGTRDIKNYPSETLLRYPLDMDGKQDCIKFTMLKYSPKKFSPSGFATGDAQLAREDPSSESRSKERGSTVTLPIQPTISDSNVVKWGAEDMNAFQAIAAATALSAMGDDFKTTEAIPGSIAQLISNASPGLKSTVMTYFAEQAAQVRGLLTRATGGIINPNTELLFQGPDLRTFNFTFSLSAREPEEAKRIRNIIRFFKQGMSVKRADTGLFLKSPHTFEIKYLFSGKPDHPWINKIKECALVSCNVNYTPAGNYATYEDGSMTQYDISLSFSELEPIYDDDYGSGGGKGNEFEIGY
jgi:hypothetical protein